MEDPFHAVSASSSMARSSNGIGVDQPGAGASAAELDQVGALAVAESGGALGVDAGRSGSGGNGSRAPLQAGLRFNDQRDAVAGCIEVNDLRGPGCRSLPP